MILISHRGNISEINKERENKEDYISEALEKDFNVEIDVWSINGNFFLGHDKPTDKISIGFLKNDKLWCHAKNFNALTNMLDNNIHCFFHDNDHYTLTSKNYIWAYPGIDGGKMTIAVKPEGKNLDLKKFSGICSDQIDKYK